MSENSQIKVSVLCLVYNHEKFLRKCLDGFVMQKTNFEYEIIIHDDMSTDGSRKIIEEYIEKYPNLFVPIFEEENQYSKGVYITNDVVLPLARGKYVAFCEGDDYWCDENKLQMQYDFMESHSDCSACFHNTLKNDFVYNKKEKFNNWKKLHYLTTDEVFCCWLVHTSSFFAKKEFINRNDEEKKYWFGDYVMLTKLFLNGKLAVLPNVMSVYNFDKIGVTFNNNTSKEISVKKTRCRINYLDYLLSIIDKNDVKLLNAIQNEKYLQNLYIFMNMDSFADKHEFRQYIKDKKKKTGYNIYYRRLSFKNKIKESIKNHCPYWLYKKLKKQK